MNRRLRKYISPSQNRFAVDCSILVDFIDNKSKYSNRPYKNHYNSFENVVYQGSGYQFNNHKLVNHLIDFRNTDGNKNRKNPNLEIPIFGDLVKKLSNTDKSKSGKYEPVLKSEIKNKDVNDYSAIFAKNIEDFKDVNRTIISQDEISSHFKKISSRVKDYVKPVIINSPLNFFDHHANFPSKKYVIYDPHLFFEQIKETRENLICGLPNLLFSYTKMKKHVKINKISKNKIPFCTLKMDLTETVFDEIINLKKSPNLWELKILDEIMLSNEFNTKINIDDGSSSYVRYVKKMAERLLFYLEWIDNVNSNKNYIPKVYFISQKPGDYDMNDVNYALNIFKCLVTNSKIYYDGKPLLTKNEYSLFNKYVDADMELLVYDKGKNTKFRDNVLLNYGADGDHRNIVLNQYCDMYWDLRKRYIERIAGKKYAIGKMKEKQVINMRSIFNEDFEENKKTSEIIEKTGEKIENIWDLNFSLVNEMIDDGKNQSQKFIHKISERIKNNSFDKADRDAQFVHFLRLIDKNFDDFYNDLKNN